MSYVRNAWYVVAWTHDIVPERLTSVCVLNEPIVLWRTAAGDLAAIEDRCIHRLAPLSLGRCEGERLRCMYHGFLYDRTGRVVEIPGQEKIPASLRVRTYPATERYGWVWLWMGAAPADESLIPPLLPLGHPGYVFGHGHLDYAARARFVTENLLDLSHVSYLHAESFRMSETWARDRPNVTEIERGVRSERWFRNEGVNGVVDAPKRVDTYFRYEFFVPGALLFTHWTYPVGTADALGGNTPHLDGPPEAFSVQAVTPISDKIARYFYIQAALRSEERTSFDMTTVDKAFAEDKRMIEAQQRIVDLTPGWRFVATTADRGIVMFNRLVEKLVREESAQVDPPAPQVTA